MAAVLRTLSELRAGVARAADINIATSGVRHTTALVNADINRSVARWYRTMAECGDDTYAVRYAITTDLSSPRLISIGAAYLYIRGIDLIRGGQPVSLQYGDFAERNEHPGSAVSTDITGFPRFYKPGPGTTTHNIRIFPAADAVYTGVATIIPPPTALSADADSIEVFVGGDEWIIADAAHQILISEGLAETATFAALAARGAQIMKEAKFTVATRNPIRKIDTRGHRLRYERGARSRW